MLSSRFGRGLERFLNRIFGPRLDASAKYRSRVVKQASDGTLEVVPLSTKLPAMTSVPIHYTVPGVTAKVSPGAMCDLMFLDSDLEFATVVGFDSGELLEIVLTAKTKITLDAATVSLGTGQRAIACVGDPVSFTVVSLPPASTLSNSGGPVVGTMVGVGVIMEGQGRVKAGG